MLGPRAATVSAQVQVPAQHLCSALLQLSMLPSPPKACPDSFSGCCSHTGGVSMLMRGDGVPRQGQDGQTAQQLLLEQSPEVVSFPGGQASVTRALGNNSLTIIIMIIMIIVIIMEALCVSVCPPARDHGEQQEQAQRPQPAAAQPGAHGKHPPWGLPSLTDTQQGSCS